MSSENRKVGQGVSTFLHRSKSHLKVLLEEDSEENEQDGVTEKAEAAKFGLL